MKVNRILKQSIVILLTIVFSASLAGCELPFDAEFVYVHPEKKLLQETVDKFFQAVDEQDTEAVKSLFAPKALEAAPDMDEVLEELYAFYPGPTESCELNGDPSGSYSTNLGVKTSEIKNWFPVISQGINYYCHITMVYEDDTDPDNIGIRQIVFLSEKAQCYDDLTWSREDGLYVIEDVPGDYETRRIGYYPEIYTSIDRMVTQQDILDFLEDSDDFDEFVSKFGQPNAVTSERLVYAYELPDDKGEKRYAAIWVHFPSGSEKGTITKVSIMNDTSIVQLAVLFEKTQEQQ